ncbi:MAG: hypothetical protein R3318_06245 [Gammaproteobacteria bacterium]|nr:hypothetical protein [Gammaproteobacteria bacterium]
MKKYLLVPVICIYMLGAVALAGPLEVSGDATIQSILAAHMDKRVTLKLKSGTELTGTVGAVNGKVVHLKELSGKEFFDAVAALKNIEAVVIRTRK